MLGPLGRPFEVDPRSRAPAPRSPGGLGMAGVRMLADEAIRDGRQVTLLFGAASAREVYPRSLLPDEVEYVVATDDGSLGHHGYVTELVPDYEAWADQAFACGPAPMLTALAAARRRPARAARRGRLGPEARRRQDRRGRFSGRPAEGVPPGVDGAEHGLRRRGVPRLRRDGPVGTPQRVCREGPVFAAEEWTGRARGLDVARYRPRSAASARSVKAKRRAVTASPRVAEQKYLRQLEALDHGTGAIG